MLAILVEDCTRRLDSSRRWQWRPHCFTRTRSPVLSEQLEAHRLPAFVFDFEVARHGSRADVEWMRLARSPIGERSEFQSRAIKLRLVSDDDGGAGGGRNACKFPVLKRGRCRNAARR